MLCMNYIAFDFETSGLPKGRRNTKVTQETLSNFDGCRAVSLSAARFSQRGRLIKTFDAIIRPDDFTIGPDSTAIHGITHERAMKEGRPFTEVFWDFMEFIGPRTKTLVAHNAQFDESVLRSEMLRHGLDTNQIEDLVIRCTLQLYKDRFLGTIKLTNLYKDIFGEEFDNAHNSLADSIACGKVYPYLIGQTERELKPLPIKKVIIGASSVASAIGINQYKKPQELVEELWKKYSPQTYKGTTKEDEALLVLNSLESTKKILEQAESFKSETSTDVQQETRRLFHQIEHSGLLPQQMVQAKDHIRKTLYTNHGTRNEQKTAKFDKFAANLVEDETFYKYDITTIEGTLYQIVGRLDRIQMNEDGSRTLVEIKNRTRGLFNRVRDYEEVQCLAYLEMLGDIEYCRLVETYNGESKSYLIQRDYSKWKDEILPKLQNFCEHFHSLLSEA
jgi:DNA polymerase III epsilon subunit-like protein